MEGRRVGGAVLSCGRRACWMKRKASRERGARDEDGGGGGVVGEASGGEKGTITQA